MSLIFGRLGQSMVNFGIILQMGAANVSPEQYLQAADDLRRETAQNALYLVYIGTSDSRFYFATVPIVPMLTFPQKASEHGAPHTSIWLSGPSLVNGMPNVSVKTTSVPSFDRTSPTSKLPAAQAKWQHVFRVIHVSKNVT